MVKKTKQKEKLVCITCGHEVDGPCHCFLNKLDRGKESFCGNCGEYGSHQPFTTASKWIKARKIMGLPAKINSY